jgi:hypothetical protein
MAFIKTKKYIICNRASSLDFNDWLCVSNKNEAEARLKDIVKEFEMFLTAGMQRV